MGLGGCILGRIAVIRFGGGGCWRRWRGLFRWVGKGWERIEEGRRGAGGPR